MIRQLPLALLILLLAGIPPFASDTNRPESEEPEEPLSLQESESKGIIPEGGVTSVSTQPVTPISLLPEKNLYDQALEELSAAGVLLKNGRGEAASDVALQAYDDLMAVYVPRRNRAKRKKLLGDRRRAATLCVDTSLAYIRAYVEKSGETPSAIKEGHARVADLRDVAVNYPELNRKISTALEQYAVTLSSPGAR